MIKAELKIVVVSMFVSGLVWAADAVPASEVAPWWAKYVAGAVPSLVLFVLGLHLLKRVGLVLEAHAAKVKASNPTEAEVEEDAGMFFEHLDAFLAQNAQTEADLVDPAKRAAAETTLRAAAEAEVQKTLASALAGANPTLVVKS